MKARYLLLLLCLLLLSGCSLHPWSLVRKATPRPYSQEAAFVVLPILFHRASINGRSQKDFLRSQGPGKQQVWRRIFTGMRHRFADEFRDAAAVSRIRKGKRPKKGELVIAPVAEYIDTGLYGGLVNRLSALRIRVKIRGLYNGKWVTFDEFIVRHQTRPNNGIMPRFPKTGQRLRRDAGFAGRYAGQYLRLRMSER